MGDSHWRWQEKDGEVMVSDNGYELTNGCSPSVPNATETKTSNYNKFNVLIKGPYLFLHTFRDQIFHLSKGYKIEITVDSFVRRQVSSSATELKQKITSW